MQSQVEFGVYIIEKDQESWEDYLDKMCRKDENQNHYGKMHVQNEDTGVLPRELKFIESLKPGNFVIFVVGQAKIIMREQFKAPTLRQSLALFLQGHGKYITREYVKFLARANHEGQSWEQTLARLVNLIPSSHYSKLMDRLENKENYAGTKYPEEYFDFVHSERIQKILLPIRQQRKH